jgi:hypothetical protein
MLMSSKGTEFWSGRDNLQIELPWIVIRTHDPNRTHIPRTIIGDFRPGQKGSERLDWVKRRRETDPSRTRQIAPAHQAL